MLDSGADGDGDVLSDADSEGSDGSEGFDGSDGVEADGDGDDPSPAGGDDGGCSVTVQSFVPPFQAAISLSLMTGRSGPLGRSPWTNPSFASSLPSNLTAPR